MLGNSGGVAKTYEEILVPTASLNDILNFDFAGRYENRKESSRQKAVAAARYPGVAGGPGGDT